MGRPFLAREAGGRSGGVAMLLVVGGGVMMANRASTHLAKGGQSAAEAGAGIMQGNMWDPQAASVGSEGGGEQAKEQEGDGGQCY